MAEGVFEGLFKKKGPVKKGCGVKVLLMFGPLGFALIFTLIYKAVEVLA